MNQLIDKIEKDLCKNEVPDFNVGDTVAVSQKIVEGKKERIQKFQGLVIKKQHKFSRASLTVRKLVNNVGVEKTFLVHSPLVVKIERISEGKVRRAKLYYIRDRIGKKATKVKKKEAVSE